MSTSKIVEIYSGNAYAFTVGNTLSTIKVGDIIICVSSLRSNDVFDFHNTEVEPQQFVELIFKRYPSCLVYMHVVLSLVNTTCCLAYCINFVKSETYDNKILQFSIYTQLWTKEDIVDKKVGHRRYFLLRLKNNAELLVE